MALLAVDSFDHYDTATISAKGWSVAAGGGITIAPGQGRNGTSSMRIVGNDWYRFATKALPPVTGSTVIFGFGFRTPTLVSQPIITVFEGNYAQLQIALTTSGALLVNRQFGGSGSSSPSNATTLITTAALVVTGIYTYIELKALLANAGGTVEIRVNGTPAGTFSGDTLASATGAWTTIKLGRDHIDTTGFTFDYDDLYVCDGSGTIHNDFLGDHRVVALLASPGNGTHVDWSTSTGGDHGALVDETPPNTTDYVHTATVNAIDTFNFPAVGVVGTVAGVQVCHYSKADVAGLRSLGNVCRIGGTDYASAGQLLGADWIYTNFLYPVSPAPPNNPWTIAEIDAAEFGPKVVA